jgi:hypothetical protein
MRWGALSTFTVLPRSSFICTGKVVPGGILGGIVTVGALEHPAIVISIAAGIIRAIILFIAVVPLILITIFSSVK